EGDVFGETAVFAEQPRTATVEALDDVVLLEITKEFFLDEEGVGYWMGRFVRALAERFCERDARAAELEQRLQASISDPSA
ncbi:MAG: cyclic nucleotide-binding domain-containing protein, partial [Myxococcota bacterium]